jgi:DNA-binding transcriptional LysR family regulator
MLEIHALRVFIEAAKVESFTKAGHVLNLSQPAVSMQIRSLEEYLDVELFERQGRTIRLTKSGQALVPMAQQLVQMALDVEENIRASGDKVVGNLVIGSSAASAKYVLPPLVARFQRLYPQVRVSIMVESRTDVMERVVKGEYDLGVTSLRVPDYPVTYSEFFTDKLVLIAPAAHPWSRRESVEPLELLDEQFVCREPTSACRVTVREGLGQLGVDVDDLQIEMEIGTPEALAMAVEYGIGVSFVSLLAALPRLMLGRLAMVNVEGLVLHNAVEFVHNGSHAAHPVQMEFMKFVNQPQNRPFIDMLAEGQVV